MDILFNAKDVLEKLKKYEDSTFHIIVTKIPSYIFQNELFEIFEELRRVMRPEATIWFEMDDLYNFPDWSLVGHPWKTVLKLQEKGWVLRNDIILRQESPLEETKKTDYSLFFIENGMDRGPVRNHKYLFLMSKIGKGYYCDGFALREGMKELENSGSIWNEIDYEYLAILSASVGCCDECGAPYKRDVKTSHWNPSCACKVKFSPIRVLDPFYIPNNKTHPAINLGCSFEYIEGIEVDWQDESLLEEISTDEKGGDIEQL